MITELGVLRFGEDKRMYLAEVFPGVSVQDVLDNTGFDLDVSRAVTATDPDPETIRILTQVVDPLHVMV